MAYTLDQLEAMGAKPVTPSATPTPTAPKKSYTAQELQTMGAKPVSLKVPEQPKKTFGEKAGGVLDAVFGFGKVGEAIGSKIAQARYNPKDPRIAQLSPEAEAKQKEMGLSTRDNVDFEGPSEGQIAGSVAQGLLNFTPVGRIAKGIGTVAKGIGAGQKLAKGTGVIGASAGTGYGYDVATGVAQGEADPLAPGAGTAVGAAIPLVPPILRGTGRAIGEGLGVTTGTGYGTIKAGLGAASKGGAEADAFRSALRGDITPEQIVDDARSALGTVIGDRTKAYRSQLEKLKTNANEFDTTPVVQKFNKQLEDFGVSFTDDGLPDFSRSPGLQRYEKDLYNMSMVLKNWGTKAGDNTVLGIDKLKQVLDDFRIGSRDSQKFDSFVTALRNEAKNLIKNEPGYDKLVKDYEQSTGLIKEIQRGLSLGDKAQTDTAFRKLTTTLRTNNEFRKQLVDELDAVTGGVLTPKIAGQQLSELLPRGLARIATGALGAGGIATGVGIVPILKAVLLTSPRLVGELLNAIGYTSSKIRKLFEVIAPKGMQFPGDMLLDTKGGQKLERSLIASAKNPSLGLAIKKSVTPKSVAEKMDREDFNKVVQIIDSPELRYSPEYERIVGDMGLIRATDEELVSFLKEAVDEFDGVAQRPVLKTAKELGSERKIPEKSTGTADPTLRTKREVSAKTVSGEKFSVPSGTVLKPMVDGAKVTIEVGGKTYTIPKNQYQNLVGQSDRATATPFAPELKDTVEVVLSDKPLAKESDIIWRDVSRPGESKNLNGSLGNRKFSIQDEGDGFYVAELDGLLGKKVKTYSQAVEELDKYLKGDTKSKYSQYTLDGGENYREILIQAPETLKKGEYGTDVIDKSQTYRSSHWSEPNVISHIRMNERTVDGKKYAFMEELQSDWAREGRDKGFIDEAATKFTSLPTGYVVKTRKIPEGVGVMNPGKERYWVESPNGERVSGVANNGEHWDKQDAIDAALRRFNKYGAVPNNPLLKNWQIPTTKRALIEAVDSGADRFAWINGEQTSARYNLATHVDEVKWFDPTTSQMGVNGTTIELTPKSGGKRLEFAVKEDGTIYSVEDGTPTDWKGKKLDEVLGKGLADKIMADKKGTLSGEGLSFGGEWAKNLYDRQVRDIVKKLTGAEVKTVDMGLGSGAKVKQWASEEFGTKLTYKQMENEGVGLVIRPIEGGQNYVVTDLLGDGKFKAVPKSAYFTEVYDPAIGIENTYKKARPDSELTQFKETFDISTPTAIQQYIDLTPEVKAKIQSKAPSFKMKTPSVADGIPLLLLMFGAASASQASE